MVRLFDNVTRRVEIWIATAERYHTVERRRELHQRIAFFIWFHRGSHFSATSTARCEGAAV